MNNSSSNDAARFISPKGLRRIEELWLDDFHRTSTSKPNAVRWWNVIHDFMSARGDEIIPGVLIDQEHRLIQAGRSQEYLATLAEVVNSDEKAPHLNEYDKTVLVLTATPEQRAEAVRRVLEYEN